MATSAVAAVIGTGRETDIVRDLPPIGEVPIINLPGKDGGKARADALQAQQLTTLAFRGFARCRRQIAFALDLDELLLHQGQSLELSADFPAETFRQVTKSAGTKLL